MTNARQSPIETEVLVVGGGTAGVVAAIAAARAGADTLLLERYGFLGGGALYGFPMHGLFDWSGAPVATGLAQEVVQRLGGVEGTTGPTVDGSWGAGAPTGARFCTLVYDPELLNLVLFRMTRESKLRMLLHSFVSDPLVNGDRVVGARFWSKSGYRDVTSKVVVDATGSGHLAARVGGRFAVRPAGNPAVLSLACRFGRADMDELWTDVQAGRLPWEVDLRHARVARGRKLREQDASVLVMELPVAGGDLGGWVLVGHSCRRGEIRLVLSRAVVADATDPSTIREAELQQREQVWDIWRMLRGKTPSLARSYIATTAPQVAVWYGRTIVGRATVTLEELLAGTSRVDGVAPVCWPVGRGAGGDYPPLRFPRPGFSIPFGALLPIGVEGLLVAGQAISAEAEAAAGVTTAGACMAVGEVAGRAAAAAARSDRLPSALDPAQLPVQSRQPV